MEQALLNIAQLCMIIAVSEQILYKPSYRKSVRLVLGMEIAAVLIGEIGNIWRLADG